CRPGRTLRRTAGRTAEHPYTFGDFHEFQSDGDQWLTCTYAHEVRDGRFRQLGSLADLQAARSADGRDGPARRR
ncbi:hypothetical protein, partial [Streptomyces sp. NPDC003832]